MSPALANHINIGNPIYTDQKSSVLSSGNKAAQFSNQPLAWDRGKTWISTSLTGIQFRPCLITVSATGAGFSPRLVNINPRIIQISSTGAEYSPKLLTVQPALIKMKATGLQFTPRNFQVNPSLIEVSPTITLKDDRIYVPKTERWGAPVFDWSGKGYTVAKGEPFPKPSELPPLPRVPKYNPNALKYVG